MLFAVHVDDARARWCELGDCGEKCSAVGRNNCLRIVAVEGAHKKVSKPSLQIGVYVSIWLVD